MADIKAGRVHGPFASVKEASTYIERVAKEQNCPRQLDALLDEHCHQRPRHESAVDLSPAVRKAFHKQLAFLEYDFAIRGDTYFITDV